MIMFLRRRSFWSAPFYKFCRKMKDFLHKKVVSVTLIRKRMRNSQRVGVCVALTTLVDQLSTPLCRPVRKCSFLLQMTNYQFFQIENVVKMSNFNHQLNCWRRAGQPSLFFTLRHAQASPHTTSSCADWGSKLQPSSRLPTGYWWSPGVFSPSCTLEEDRFASEILPQPVISISVVIGGISELHMLSKLTATCGLNIVRAALVVGLTRWEIIGTFHSNSS